MLGEKLKMEVKQREEIILHLQKNIKTLSSANLESTKDKMALCMELNEASCAKQHLNTVLDTEIKKNSTIQEERHQVESDAATKV